MNPKPNDPEAQARMGHAMLLLFEAMPKVKRPNRRTGRDEPMQEVRFIFRRRTGQWLAQVGQFSAARPDPVDALYDIIARINEA